MTENGATSEEEVEQAAAAVALTAGPAREGLDPTPRGKLVENVQDALAALPVHFSSRTFIEGLEAGDLFSLNSMLGGSIEIQVVETLNKLRAVWDTTKSGASMPSSGRLGIPRRPPGDWEPQPCQGGRRSCSALS